jgi:hypothetical protein
MIKNTINHHFFERDNYITQGYSLYSFKLLRGVGVEIVDNIL